MKLLHPLVAQLLNVFAQKVFQPSTVHFRRATPERSARKRKASAYGRGLANHFAAENRQRMAVRDTHPLADQHGAYTLTGGRVPCTHAVLGGAFVKGTPGRRMWVGGISAQRGY